MNPDVLQHIHRLFFYRDDVHAVQYFNRKTGRGGYAKDCTRAWSADCKAFKDKGRGCNGCPHWQPEALTDALLQRHLEGKRTLGAYQLRDDDTVGWLCIDMDAPSREEQAQRNARELAVLIRRFLQQMGLGAHLEYSGNKGAHVWVFFAPGVAAADARRLGQYAVAQVLDEQGDFAGVDDPEVFPKQDQVDDKNPYGNLVKVPLGVHKKTGRRTAFVTDDWTGIEDQAAYLASIEQHTPEELTQVLDDWGVPAAEPTRKRRKARGDGDHELGLDDVGKAAAALQRLASWRRDDYGAWLDVGMALSELGAPGLALWDSWSQGSAKYEPGACDAKWGTFTPGDGLTLGSLLHWAGEDSPTQSNYPHLTDMGNAERLVARHGEDLRYCDPLGGWLVWNDKRWVPDTTGEVERRAKETVRSIYAEAAQAMDLNDRKEIAEHAANSESAPRLRAMMDLARSELGIPVRVDVFDADPWALNVNNGTIDLQTGELRPHRREDLITKLAPVDYDPKATSAVLDKYLADATADDADLAAYVQRAAGYSLTGLTIEEVFFLVLGPGGSGKTTLAEALLTALGDYATKANFAAFLETRNVGGPQPEIAMLRGARFVAAVEAPPNKRLAEALVKELTGGDTITVRHLYHEPFSFKPALKLWLAANESPRITDTDSGIWRRLRRVPFEHEIPKAERDPKIKAYLCSPEGGRALLAWAVAGCLAWQRKGLGTCQAVGQRTAELRADMDPIGEFLAGYCIIEREAEAPALELREAYEGWAKEMGAKAINDREWGRRLRALGAKSARRRMGGPKVSIWRGIGLLTDEEPESGHTGHTKGLFQQNSQDSLREGDFVEKVCPVCPVCPDEEPEPVAATAPRGSGYHVRTTYDVGEETRKLLTGL